MLISTKIGFRLSPFYQVTESMINFSFRSRTILNSLSETDSKTLSISKMELFMTINNNFQQLTIVAKTSSEFLDQPMGIKDDCQGSSLFDKFQAAFSRCHMDMGSIQKDVSGRSFVSMRKLPDRSDMHSGQKVVRYIPNSFWRRKITSEKLLALLALLHHYYTAIIFDFQNVIAIFFFRIFLIFDCYLQLSTFLFIFYFE